MKLRHLFKRASHSVWVQMQESGAIRTGEPIELDPRYTGDRFSPSPTVREVFHADYHEHSETTTHVRGRER